MASKKQQQETTGIENINESLTSVSDKIAQNKKVVFGVIGAIVVVALGIFGWKYLYQQPKNAESITKYGNVEVLAEGNDSIAVAGYLDVVKEYEGFAGGNLAALRAGQILFDQAKYAEAIESLNKFETEDVVMMANAQCLVGDCYVNLDKLPEAVESFDKAIATANGNSGIVPRILMKKATVFDAQKEYAKALEAYQTIKKEYPQQAMQYGVDALIERENARLGK